MASPFYAQMPLRSATVYGGVGAHMIDARTIFMVTRAEINARAVTGIRRQLDIILTSPDEVARNRNNVAIYIADFDDDERELFLIPEVREWFHRLFEVVPEIFFWMNMQEGFLTFYALMMMAPKRIEGGTTIANEDMQRFLIWGYQQLNVFCKKHSLAPEPANEHISNCLSSEGKGS